MAKLGTEGQVALPTRGDGILDRDSSLCEAQTLDRPELVWEATGVEQKMIKQVGIDNT